MASVPFRAFAVAAGARLINWREMVYDSSLRHPCTIIPSCHSRLLGKTLQLMKSSVIQQICA